MEFRREILALVDGVDITQKESLGGGIEPKTSRNVHELKMTLPYRYSAEGPNEWNRSLRGG